MVDDSVLVASQLELLLYGDVQGRIPVWLFTDSESTLELVASTKQISTKTLRKVIVDLRERLFRGEIFSYLWLPTQNMRVDVLTKERNLQDSLEDVLLKNDMNLADTTMIQVKAFGQKVCVTNIQNRKAALPSSSSAVWAWSNTIKEDTIIFFRRRKSVTITLWSRNILVSGSYLIY